MTPSLDTVLRAVEREGVKLDGRAIHLVKTHYAQLDLQGLIDLIYLVAAIEDRSKRIGSVGAVMEQFDALTEVLGEPPQGTKALLEEATHLGLTTATELVNASGYAPLYELPATREIEYVRHSSARLDSYWGPHLTKFRQQVQAVLEQGFDRGQNPDEIVQALTQRTNVSRNAAILIVRNETGNAQGYAMAKEQQALGFTHYIWSTAKDSRVRPEHQVREGKVFAWDEPPSDGHPGEPILCRCVAIPARLEDFIN